jgi:MOSC domain-containing protein YiiM
MKRPVGKVTTLFISQINSKNRVQKDILYLDTLGITSDKYYNTNIQRSVLITSLSSYTLAQKHNIQMPFGSLGENLLIDYNPYHLASGTTLEIGSARLEISQNCTICEHLSTIDKRLPVLLEKDRGIFAKVVNSGEIKEGDTIYLVK